MGIVSWIMDRLEVPPPDDRPDRLAKLAATIDRGLKHYMQAGEALREIRDTQLYRLEATTFEEFCLKRWRMTPQHANRLIAAADVARDLEPIGSIPQTESQARPLAQLPREQRAEAYREAAAQAGGEPTAAHIAAAVHKRVGTKSKRKTKLKPIRIRLPGCTLTIEPNKAFASLEEVHASFGRYLAAQRQAA